MIALGREIGSGGAGSSGHGIGIRPSGRTPSGRRGTIAVAYLVHSYRGGRNFGGEVEIRFAKTLQA
jgi:hypothetical protein